MLKLTLLLSATTFLLSTQSWAQKAKNATDDGAQQIEALCSDPVERAAAAIAQINTAGATKTKISKKGVKQEKVEYEAQYSHDDKTKTYQVIAEFDLHGKWCQIQSVKLTRIPM